jgi:hypothetical protein
MATPRSLILGVALGAGAAGYFLGGLGGREDRGRPPEAPPRSVYLEAEPAPEPPAWEEPGEEQIAALEAAASALAEDLPPATDLLDALRRSGDAEKSQILLIGMVANAARKGGAALPELRDLLDSGIDLKFPSWEGGLGYPSLRVALLAAAEATGDPAAAQLIAEVTRAAESPVEVVFGAHVLDRLKALDAPTAQRTLEALGRPLADDQRKAMASIAGRVVPAAAAADPAYAEVFLATQLRMPKGTGADPRMVAPVLDGLPAARAEQLVLAHLAAGDVTDGAKKALAARATQRSELSMLSELRRGIEAGVFTPDVAATVAHGAVANRAYGRIEREAKHALKAGDVATARQLASTYYERLAETEQTVEAARKAGAKLRGDLGAYTNLQRQRLDALRREIRKKQAQAAR